jgi:peptidoglycan/LPS O-acetylase OafA/YrhL
MIPEAQRLAHGGRLSLVDAMRAVAVVAVVLFHVFPRAFPGGFIGVDVFFTISGFVIALNYLGPLVRRETGFAAFFLRRVRRLVPAYFVALFATALAALAVMVPKDLVNFGASLAAQGVYLQNAAFWQQGDYFDDPLFKPLLHTWSLAVEEQFYIAFPLLVFAFRWRHAVGWFALLAATAASVALGIYVRPLSSSAVFFMLPFRVWEFTVGIIAALAYSRIAAIRIGPVLGSGLGLAGLALLVTAIAAFDESARFPSVQAALAIAGVCLVIFAEPHAGPALSKAADFGPVQHFGRISYSWYLWHWPVVTIPFIYHGRPATFPEAAVQLALGYLLGAASYRYVEVPAMRWPWLRSSGRTVGLVGAFAGFALILGLLLTQSLGWIDRYEGRERRLYAAQMDRPPYRCPLLRRLASSTDYCQINNATGPAGILLIGDTHADMVKPAFAAMAENAGRPFYLAMKSCRLVAKDMKAACGPKLIANVVANIRRGRITNVIVIGRYSETFDQPTYAQSVRAMTGAGARVTIVTSNPESRDFDPDTWIRTGHTQDWPARSHYARKDYERDQATQLAAMRTLAREDARIQLIEPYQRLCPDHCIIALGDRPLYHDRHHLTSAGVAYIAPLFADIFQDSVP